MSNSNNFKDLTGIKFGYLTALYADKTHPQHTYWCCQCVCGNQRLLASYQLTSGSVTSCGCMNPRTIKGKLISAHKRLYALYSSMIARCENPKSISYKYYGDKGISVCEEWHDFSAFCEWALSNGYEDTLSIDRIDNNKGYSPDNCRWIPLKDQANNKTTNLAFTHNGETHNMKEWCAILNLPYSRIKDRRKYAKRVGRELSFEELFH